MRGIEAAECLVCGTVFGRTQRKNRRRSCSVACRAKLRRREGKWKIHERVCLECSALFKAEHIERRYCGNRCRALARRSRHSRECAVCRNSDKVCKRCDQDTQNAHVARRRALLLGVVIEQFDNTEIFERDGWRCQICHRKTRPNVRRDHPLKRNLDHIIPVMKGGGHTRLNVQCLCRACNAKKSAGMDGQQLRLIG